MENKQCPRCSQAKPIIEFDKSWCKSCRRVYAQERYHNKKSDPNFAKKLQENKRKYRNSKHGKEVERQYKNHYRLKIENKEREREIAKKYYLVNKDKRLRCAREWAKKNPERIKELNKKFQEDKKSDPIWYFSNKVRHLIKRTFKKNGLAKNSSTFILLKYSKEQLCEHLNPYLGNCCEVCHKVVINMKNSHLDHIEPICRAKTIDDVIRLNQLNNLRMICGSCNLKKSSSFTD